MTQSGNPIPSPAAALLAKLADVVARQRAAIIARDVVALRGLTEALSRLLSDLELVSQADIPLETAARQELTLLAGQIGAQIDLNRTLLRNGLAVADHYLISIAEASAAAGPVLFSGVA